MIELAIYLGLVGPTRIIIGTIIYLLLTISSLYLILKNEKKLFIFFWILLILFIPFLGSIIYLFKHFINRKPASVVN